jgi:two-component system sensor histidine kinase KdpD
MARGLRRTPELQRIPEHERGRILKILRLAHELGAQTATLPGQNAIDAVIDYCGRHNLSKVVVGRDPDARIARRFSPPYSRSLTSLMPRLARAGDNQAPSRESGVPQKTFKAEPMPGDDASRSKPAGWAGYLWTVGYCAAATLIAWPLPHTFARVNIAMLFSAGGGARSSSTRPRSRGARRSAQRRLFRFFLCRPALLVRRGRRAVSARRFSSC